MIQIFTLVLVASIASVGFAQTISLPVNEVKPEPEVQPAKIDKPVEKVVVTGSHIKRIDVEGVAPVQTITRKEIEKTGYNSVSDVLRDTTASSFGGAREASGSNAAGVAHVNLRGLGSSSTLVLLNGQRLPTDAVTGAVDLNLIPMAAVERIEVMKDGASATYGSDALGGVVNIITRKDFSGSEIAISNVQPEQAGGQRREISLVNGFNAGRLNMVNTVQYRKNEAVFSRDRKFTSNGLSPTGSPGSYRNSGGQWQADASCPPELLEDSPQGKICNFRHTDFSTRLPELEQFSLLSESNVDVSERVRVKARLGGTQRTVKWQFAPSPGTFNIGADVAKTLGPGGGPLPGVDPNQDLQVRYRVVELGARETVVDTKGYNALLGSTVDVGAGWEVEATAAHNHVQSRDEGVSGYALRSGVESAIESGQFNPFASGGARGDLSATRYKPVETTSSDLTSADVKASGEIGHLPAGRIGLAIGTGYTFQKYSDKVDEKTLAGEVFGGSGSNGEGQRDIRSVYSEMNFPVTKKIELQLAGRYDEYSDFGSTTNPKAGLMYRPTKSLLLRGSVGTGFKAPLMQDLYASQSMGAQTFVDATSCNRERAAGGATPACSPRQHDVVSGGNPGLKEERSLSYMAGAVFQPTSDFNIGADYFLTKLNNKVGIDYDEAMEAEAAGVNLADQGVIVKRDANGYIESVEAPLQNLSAQEVSGLDLSTSYRVWKMKFAVDHSLLFYFREEGFPGAGLKNKLGENGKPPWRNTASVSFYPGERHDITASGLTTAGHRKTVKEAGKLPAYTSYDLLYSYKSKKLGTFTGGVKNVLGTTPPIDDSNPSDPLDVDLYDQVGRQLYTGYKATF